MIALKNVGGASENMARLFEEFAAREHARRVAATKNTKKMNHGSRPGRWDSCAGIRACTGKPKAPEKKTALNDPAEEEQRRLWPKVKARILELGNDEVWVKIVPEKIEDRPYYCNTGE